MRHYSSLENTQSNLNVRLIEKLKQFKGKDSSKQLLKIGVLNFVKQMDTHNQFFQSFVLKNNIQIKQLSDRDFVEKFFLNTKEFDVFEKKCTNFQTFFNKLSSSNVQIDFLGGLKDEKGNNYSFKDYYFKNLPNGSFISVIEHFKTAALFAVTKEIFKNDFSLGKIELISPKQAKFLQSFRSKYSIGEKVEFTILTGKSMNRPVVKVKGQILKPSKIDSTLLKYSFIPEENGNFPIDISFNGERVLTNIEISKPKFKLVSEKSTFDGEVGNKLRVYVDPSFKLPKGALITCDYGEILFKDQIITVTPTKQGKLGVYLKYNGVNVDKFDIYAHQPLAVNVTLQDNTGSNSSISQAHRLESTNTYWQVVGFRMTVVDKKGVKKSLKSATRFLRNDIKELESSALKGSAIIFDEISVVGKEFGQIGFGKPIIFIK